MKDNYTRFQELQVRLNWVIAEIDQTAVQYEMAVIENKPKEIIDALYNDLNHLKSKLSWFSSKLSSDRQAVWDH
jgi:hypothetical protein